MQVSVPLDISPCIYDSFDNNLEIKETLIKYLMESFW